MSFAQGALTQPLILQGSNVFLYGTSTSGNAFTVQQLSAGNVASFQTSTGATAMMVNPSGYVGIGTTNPSYILDVNGPARMVASTLTLPTVLATTSIGIGTTATPPNKLSVLSTTAQLASSAQISHPAGDWGLVIKRAVNDVGSSNFAFLKSRGEASTIITQGDGIGRIAWHAVTNATGPVVQQLAEINVTNTTFTGGNADGAMIFLTKQTTDANPVERMRMLPSGKVGIGTTNAAGLLHIGTGTDVYGQTMGLLCTNPGNNWINACFGQSGLPKIVIGNLNSVAVIGAHDATLSAWANLALCPIGNVGIGTYTPGRRLHVYDAATSGAGPFVVDQFATSGFTDTVTLIRGGQAASSSWGACYMQSSSGSNNLFYVRGDGYVWAANDITAFSDARVKTNLQKIEGALDKVSNINGYTFTRTDYTSEEDRDKRHVGVIAQEIQKVLPELVHEDDKGMLSVAYGNMTALLIEAIKEERQKREVLEERLERLEKLLLKE